VFATGGASGITGVALYLAYKFFTTRHRVRSVCCGREMSISTEADTPVKINQDLVVKNELHCSEVQQGSTDSGVAVGEGRTRKLSGTDAVAVSEDRQAKAEAKPSSRRSSVAARADTES
jgi:hypothetical protein